MNKKVKILFDFPNSRSVKVRRGYIRKINRSSFDMEEDIDGIVTYSYKYMNKLTESYRYKVGKDGKYIRNPDYTFKKFPLTELEIQYIRKYARMTFNAYMVKLIRLRGKCRLACQVFE